MRASSALRALVRRSMPATFGVAVLFAAACLAAVAAHYAIDAIGDFALPHDTYDHIGHVSRSIATLGAAVLALFGALVVVVAALADARRFRGALRAVLGAHGLRDPARILAAIVPATFSILVAMESIDGRIATGLQPSLASTLGGSIGLGSTTAAVLASLVAVALWQALRILSASERRIAFAIGRLVDRSVIRPNASGPIVTVLPCRASSGRGSILSRRAGKRAPPQAA
jgi:hypothetical protein